MAKKPDDKNEKTEKPAARTVEPAARVGPPESSASSVPHPSYPPTEQVGAGKPADSTGLAQGTLVDKASGVQGQAIADQMRADHGGPFPKTEGERSARRAKVTLPTRGRFIDFVTDEKILVSALVTDIYKDDDDDVVRLHVCAMDPVFGNRNFVVADAEAAHRETIGSSGLKTRKQVLAEQADLEPLTWTWPVKV